MSKYISTSEVAKMIGVTPQTVLNWMKSKKPPFTGKKVGSKTVILESDVKDYLKKSVIKKKI